MDGDIARKWIASAVSPLLTVIARGESSFFTEELRKMAGIGVAHVEGGFHHALLRFAEQAFRLVHVPTDKAVLRQWLKAGYVENRHRFPTEAGTPQGGIISPTLANMTLDGMEALLLQHFPRVKWKDGKLWRPKVNLVRYADDFIITGDSN